MQEHKTKVKTDTLQQLHTSVNLSELLDAGHEGIDPTLRDDSVNIHVVVKRPKLCWTFENLLKIDIYLTLFFHYQILLKFVDIKIYQVIKMLVG